jgi:transcriptional regulator with XRE-family HTH domain
MTWFKSTPESEALLAEERLVLAATEAVDEAMLISGTNRQRLAELINVKPSEISQRLSGRRNLTLRSLAQMLHVLGWRAEITIVAAQPPVGPEGDDADRDWCEFGSSYLAAALERGERHWQMVVNTASAVDTVMSGPTLGLGHLEASTTRYEAMGVLGGFARQRPLDDDQSTMAACK